MNYLIKASTIVLACLLMLVLSCTPTQLPLSKNSITIAAITNTRPISPFKAMPESRTDLVKTINIENPDLVVHAGNLIYGGHAWMGISETDITDQFKAVKKLFSGLTAAFYPVTGEYDTFNDSFDLYTKILHRPINYSFNFDNTHFIVVNNVRKKETAITINWQWLINDLELHKQYPETIVVTHNPVITQKNKPENKNAAKLHNIFTQYNVKLVISGNKYHFYETSLDGIHYINIFSDCFEDNYNCRHAKQIFIITYKNSMVTVYGKPVIRNDK